MAPPDAAWVEPLGVLDGPAAGDAVAAGLALPLAGGMLAFTLVRLIGDGRIVPVDRVPPPWRAALATVTAAPPDWAGLGPPLPRIMGVLNVTPDSFSDGGAHYDPARAIAAGVAMAAAGADLVDVGGESTRPGSHPTDAVAEQARVLPVVRALAAQGIAVSIDTRRAAVMAAALDAGARLVNDVSALSHDEDAAALVAARGCPVVLMHMRHDPATMTALARYGDVAREVAGELAARIAAAEAAGIPRARIAIDPGIGFAKTGAHNLELLPRLGLLLNLGCPIVVGVSRKRFLGTIADIADPRRRVPGSIAAALHAIVHGAAILRVHDVADTVQAVKVWRALTGIG